MTFSLIRKGNLEHYLKTFQKELLKSVSKSTQLPLVDEYHLVVTRAIETEAMEQGHNMNPDPIPNQLVFSIKLYVNKENLECGLMCFSKSNWNNPDLIEQQTWGRVFFPLVHLHNQDPLGEASFMLGSTRNV